MKRFFIGEYGGAGAVALGLLMLAAFSPPAQASPETPGACAEDAPITLTRPDGTTEEVHCIWGVMSDKADALRARASITSTVVKKGESTTAVAGFDSQMALSSRSGGIFSDIPPNGLRPANPSVFNGGRMYNLNANVGLDKDGNPNTLINAYSNSMSNMVDTHFGNSGGLQRQGSLKRVTPPPSPGAPMNAKPVLPGETGYSLPDGPTYRDSFSMGGAPVSSFYTQGLMRPTGVDNRPGGGYTAAGVRPTSRGGSMNFGDSRASDLGMTRTGKTAGLAQSVNHFIYGMVKAAPLAIAGAVDGGTDPATPLLPFSQQADAMDYTLPDTSAYQTMQAISDPMAGSTALLRIIPGSPPPVCGKPGENGCKELLDVEYGNAMSLSPGDSPNVLAHGLPAYYTALCRVMDGKWAMDGMMNGSPGAAPSRASWCPVDPNIRPVPSLASSLTTSFVQGYTDPFFGLLSSPEASMVAESLDTLHSVATGKGWKRFDKLWFAGGSSTFSGPGAQSGGHTAGVPFIGHTDLAIQDPAGMVPAVSRGVEGAVNGKTFSKVRQDTKDVMKTARDGVPRSTEQLPSWRDVPTIQPKMSPSGVVSLMP